MLEKTPDVAQVLAGESQRTARGRLWRWGGLAVLVVAIAGGLWLWGAGAFRGAAIQYNTEVAASGDILVSVVATGTVEPTGQVDVSSTISGTIASVDVDYNAEVSRGQVLARLDMGDLDVRLTRAVAMVEAQQASQLSAQSGLDDATAAVDRAQALAATNGVSVRDVELATSALKRAQASLAGADAQLKAAQADLQAAHNDYDKGCLCSPIDGVVFEINVDPGQNISTASLGQPMFRIVEDLKHLNLLVDIDEADIGRVKTGDKASFGVEAWPNRAFEGTIRQIRYAPAVVDGVVSYKAELLVDNGDLLLRPGMTATAEIAVDSARNVLTVANAALRFAPSAAASGNGLIPASTAETVETGPQHVWVLRAGQPVAVEVTTGLSDGQRTEITGGGLNAGDEVIVGTKSR